MPKIELTTEELELLLECTTRQRDGDLLRLKTLESLLPKNVSIENDCLNMKEHIKQNSTYTDIINKIKQAKKSSSPVQSIGWFK